jgi:hypothetical protein
MITDYNNARGHLIDNLATYTYATPFWVDNLPSDPQSPDVWIVEAGSYDENVLNYVYGFSACSSSTALGEDVWCDVLWYDRALAHRPAEALCPAEQDWQLPNL